MIPRPNTVLIIPIYSVIIAGTFSGNITYITIKIIKKAEYISSL